MQPKEIISQFLRIDANTITANTLINRQALKSSIFLHRMYGKLADAGFVVADYSNINSFGELENILNGNSTIKQFDDPTIEQQNNSLTYNSKHQTQNSSIGIDIESIDNLPKTNDFRTQGFYTDNFSEKEIAYCILQPNPYASFTGLFAAKEAIIKANNLYKNIKFNQLIITHNAQGKPEFDGINISISHTNDSAVAVAVLIKNSATTIVKEVVANSTYSITTLVIAVAALLIALAAFFSYFF
jgi:phosphopantetheine--protein transferase-like protein